MLRNRWKISPGVEPAPAVVVDGGPEVPAPPRKTARDRMKVVPFRGPGA
jgi:hypothetical protein